MPVLWFCFLVLNFLISQLLIVLLMCKFIIQVCVLVWLHTLRCCCLSVDFACLLIAVVYCLLLLLALCMRCGWGCFILVVSLGSVVCVFV